MPAISRIRFTNVVYENGGKRYNDDIFEFDGYNGAILLENGGGKTVFIQTAIQSILPHQDLADRKIIDTLSLEGNPCHIAIEWILNDRPRRYAVTCVTLFLNNNKLNSYKYVYEYGHNDNHSLENIPFVKKTKNGLRPSSKGEIGEYYSNMKSEYINAYTFKTIRDFHNHIEENFKIIPSEWRKISLINSAEGSVEEFFDGCKTTGQLVDKLLIPVVEEAISDNGTEDFVNTFDKQRDRFKKHKQLTERIDECGKIREKIKDYVDVFSKYNSIKNEYHEKKRYAKGLFNLAKKRDDELTYKLDENKKNKEKLEKEKYDLKKMKESFKVYKLKVKKEDEKKIFKEKLNEFLKVEKEYNKKDKRYITLDILKLKLDIKTLDDDIVNIKNQIDILNKDRDVSKLQDKLNKNSKYLKGYFDKEKNNLDREFNLINSQLNNYQDEYDDLLNKEEEISSKRDELNKSINEKNGEIKILNKDIDAIKGMILDNKDQDVKDSQTKWKERIAELEKQGADLRVNIQNLKTKKEEINYLLPRERSKQKDLYNNLRDVQNKIKLIKDEEIKQLNKIREIDTNFKYIESIYTKEKSIINTLENKIEYLNRQKEDLLKDERKVSRLYDDYMENNMFTAEPLLEKIIINLKGDFSYIELGVKFIQRVADKLGKDEGIFFDKYPNWPLTIIVKKEEVNKLKEKLSKQKGKITYPIFILQEDKALDIIKNDKKHENLVVPPEFWRGNLKESNFLDWKNGLGEEFKRVNKLRRDKEKNLDYHRDILKGVKNFFINYSYDELKQFTEKKHSLKEEIENLDEKIINSENELKSIDEEILRINDNLQQDESEKHNLNFKIQKAQSFISKVKDLKDIIEKKFSLEKKLKEVNRKIKKIKSNIKSTLRTIEDLKDNRKDFNDRINSLKEDELYKEVKEYKGVLNDNTKEGLKSERKRLTDILNEKQKDIKYYKEELIEKNKKKEKLNKDLDRKLNMCEYDIALDLTFPSYGEDEMNNLVIDLNNLKPRINKLENELNKAKKGYEKIENKYEFALENYLKEYDEIIKFKDEIYKIEESLNLKNKKINERKENLDNIYDMLSSEKKEIDDSLKKLEMKNERYLFLSDNIEALKLDGEMLKDFLYNKEKYIKNVIDKLSVLFEEIDYISNSLNTEKSKFIGFCNNNITDPKLRNMAIGGVNYKKSYDDIKRWQNQMDENITRTINIATHDMRQHDKEIQQFIEHLYVFLRSLTDELKDIPKKTRIKVEDKWKEIYRFNIPDWEEQKGKEELRNHVNWMINQLENNDYKNDDGSENPIKIRNKIEKWLNSKQLLRIVLKDKVIKINCRKVTNDGRISSAPTSWENSNKWSGGEKWSKNMTLFLGILNYLAEKRQNINTTNKTNRTVIVDNPFGKASSDHVLDPVFFIAEKLGFQIIALTAHTDGKYIRNYFPVVYSCKLREASNGKSFIIDKEKEIKYAFFKDNDPKALNRLSKQEQIDFLGQMK
ncbi:MAG: hypothetical protein FH751_15470 [Firmicutes bacterium]|nr:hypothetical protein [Bacillota bacterium]